MQVSPYLKFFAGPGYNQLVRVAPGLVAAAKDLSGVARGESRYLEGQAWQEAGRLIPEMAVLCPRTFLDGDLYLQIHLAQFPELMKHAAAVPLLKILSDRTPPDESGFPQISRKHFDIFISEVPHLFKAGSQIIQWLDQLEKTIRKPSPLAPDRVASVLRAAQVIRTLVYTASITAPPNLWLLRYLLSTHKKLGTLEHLNRGEEIKIADYAKKQRLDPDQLSRDLHVLYNRGYLDRTKKGFIRTLSDARYVLEEVETLSPDYQTDMVQELRDWFEGKADGSQRRKIKNWISYPSLSTFVSGWIANWKHIEIGYRLSSILVALKASGLLKGNRFEIPPHSPELERILEEVGLISEGKITDIGARVFRRGPGTSGIIGAYHPYLNQHEALLKALGAKPHVVRGFNVAASRDANEESFTGAIELIHQHGSKKNSVIIEHAVGHAVGLQLFIRRFGEEGYSFVAADKEEAALQAARHEQEIGNLPKTLKFIRTDIGDPRTLLNFLQENGMDPGKAVMIIGNGLHEARGMTNSKMVEMIRQYGRADITLVATEESLLTHEQMRETAWNTYQSAFWWVHETSGQLLRAPWAPEDQVQGRDTWKRIFEEGDYRVSATVAKRRIFPCPMDLKKNTPISVTFLCVPHSLGT